MTKIYPPKYLETGMANNEPTFPQGYEIVEIEADDSSYYQDSYQNSTFIELHFKLDHYYDFKKYSRLEHHLDNTYGLGGASNGNRAMDHIVTLEEPTFTKHSDTYYEYTLKFYNGEREKYFRRFVKDPQTRETTFSLTGTELQHLECIIRSIVTGWNIDDVMMQVYLGQFTGIAYKSNYQGSDTWNATPFWQASEEMKTISYDNTTCADALEQLSEQYGHAYNYNFEFLSYFYIPNGVLNRPWVDQSGKYGFRLYSDTAENNTALMYGKNNGLKSIKATGVSDIVDILFVNGSEKNLIIDRNNANHYDSDTLHMPKATNGHKAILLYNGDSFLPATGVYRENDGHSVPSGYTEYVASAIGKSVMKLGTNNTYGREESASFPDVYPSRVGTVNSVSVNSNGIYSIFDSAIDSEYHVPDGVTDPLTIIFQDGALAGIEFECRNGEASSYIFTSYSTPNTEFVQQLSNTYSKVVKSFTLSEDSDVLLSFKPKFELITGRFNQLSDFYARCYLKKGNTTLYTWYAGYSYYLEYVEDEIGPYTELHITDSDNDDIRLTTSLTAGSYDIVIELTSAFSPTISAYVLAYIYGMAQATYNCNLQIVPKEIGEETLPNSTLHPAVGDHYVIVNCEMPTSYVTEAEINLFKEAVKQLAEYQEDGTTYSVDIDGKFMNNHDTINRGLSSGLCLKIQDSSFMTPARTFRIVNVKRPYNNENSPTIEISNVRKKKSRIDGFTHSIIDLGVAIADNFERISANNAQQKSTKQELQRSIESANFNQSVLNLKQIDIKNEQASMDKRITENESQIQQLWKAIGK